jgi:hypothetical protein
MFDSYFVLSLDACIVTITWSLICCYCSVGYLSNSVDYSSNSLLECFTDVGVFPHILAVDGETFDFTCGRGDWV